MWVEEVEIQRDETWIVANVFDGQTHVPRDITFEITVGYRDFEEEDRAYGELPEGAVVLLTRALGNQPVPCAIEVEHTRTLVKPLAPLSPDADYELDAAPFVARTTSVRMAAFPIDFSTRAAPRVTGLWRVGATLMIAFSEPMDPDTLYLGHDSVDLIWEEDGELRSAATHHNLAGYVWETRGDLFALAPISFADDSGFGSLTVMVAADVLGESGVPLDGDGDRRPGEVDDDYFQDVTTTLLPECFTREDIPDPCVHERDVPDLI